MPTSPSASAWPVDTSCAQRCTAWALTGLAYPGTVAHFNLVPIALPDLTVGTPIAIPTAFHPFPTCPAVVSCVPPISAPAVALTVTPDGHEAFVADANANTLVPVDLIARAPSAPISLGGRPILAAMAPNGQTAYVVVDDGALHGELVRVSVADRQVEDRIPVGVAPNSVVITPDGSAAFITDSGGTAGYGTPGGLVRVDLATDVASGPLPLPGFPQDAALSPDGTTVYAVGTNEAHHTTITPIDVRSYRVGAAFEIGTWSGSSQVVADADGTLYVLSGTPLGGCPTGIPLCQGQLTMTAVSPATHSSGTPIFVHGQGVFGVRVSPSGDTAYLLTEDPSVTRCDPINSEGGQQCSGANYLVAVDPHTGRISQPADLGHAATDFVLARGPG